MNMEIPELSLVVLIGPSGSGKSTFARKHFLPTEVISSDFCRALVADDENDLSATKRAFEVLHFIVSKRLETGKLALVDATNVRPEDRKSLVDLARTYHTLPVAIVFDLPEKVSVDRNWMRTDRALGPHVVHQQVQQMHRGLRNLEREGFRHVFTFRTEADVEAATIQRRGCHQTRWWWNPPSPRGRDRRLPLSHAAGLCAGRRDRSEVGGWAEAPGASRGQLSGPAGNEFRRHDHALRRAPVAIEPREGQGGRLLAEP